MQNEVVATAASLTRKYDKPKMPVIYEQACRELADCVTIDEAVYWNDKAEALAAWAKIYKDGTALREAQKLKLHAHKRMGKLGQELSMERRRVGRPTTRVGRTARHRGPPRGARSILIGSGLTPSNADAALAIAGMSEEEFGGLLDRERVPSPTTARRYTSGKSNDWNRFQMFTTSFRSYCRSADPKEIAASLLPDERAAGLRILREIIDWCEGFEHYCSPRET
jgi:hypothetical protein